MTLVDNREALLFMTGLYSSISAWSTVAHIDAIRSNIDQAVHHCCDKIYNGNFSCSEQIVRTFGAGISVSDISHLCNSSFELYKKSFEKQLAFNLTVGVLGTAVALSILVIIGLRKFSTQAQKSGAEETESECVGYLKTKNAILFTCAGALIADLTLNLGIASTHFSKVGTAVEACCTDILNNIPPSVPACLSSLGSIIGKGYNVSTYADLCGSGLPAAQAVSQSTIINISLILSGIALLGVGTSIFIGYKRCQQQSHDYVPPGQEYAIS